LRLTAPRGNFGGTLRIFTFYRPLGAANGRGRKESFFRKQEALMNCRQGNNRDYHRSNSTRGRDVLKDFNWKEDSAGIRNITSEIIYLSPAQRDAIAARSGLRRNDDIID